MADTNTAKTAPKTATRKAPAKKAASKKAPARKTAAKKTTTKKTAAKKTTAKRDLRSVAATTGRNALRASLGVYGKAYDQLQDQFEALQKQVDDAQGRLDDRRAQAEKLYDSLVKRGTQVEKEALKAFEDLELDALTDRSKLEAQMNKAKAKFEELRAKLAKA